MARRPSPVAGLRTAEAAEVLRELLSRRPELGAVVEAIIAELYGQADAETVAKDVESSLRALGVEALFGRAGRTPHGYVSPGEAAQEILEEFVDPHRSDMARHVESGRLPAGIATCRGLLAGLYAVRRTNSDGPLGHAPDYPLEAACDTVRVFVQAWRKRHGADTPAEWPFLDIAPEWSETLGDVARHA